MTIIELLLVIAAYQRKANHPEETDAQIAAGVIADIAKVRAAMRGTDLSLLDAGSELDAGSDPA